MLVGWTTLEANAILATVSLTAFAPVWALHAVMEALGYKHMGLPPESLPGGGLTLPQDLANAYWSEYQVPQDQNAGLEREFERETLHGMCNDYPLAGADAGEMTNRASVALEGLSSSTMRVTQGKDNGLYFFAVN